MPAFKSIHQERIPGKLSIWLLTLSLLLVVSLGLHGALLYTGWRFLPPAREMLDQAIATLDELGREQFSYRFPVQDQMPVVMDIPFEDTFSIPFRQTIPIHTQIPIDEVVEVPVNTPLGTLSLRIPIRMAVPVDLEVPIDLQVEVPVQKTIHVSTTVPISMAVPVEISLAETPLKRYLDELRSQLLHLRSRLGD